MNESKPRDSRMWEKWDRSGALGTYKDSLLFSENLPIEYRRKFGQLQSQIRRTLLPGRGLIVFTTDPEDPPNGYHLAINKKGKWNLGFGREGAKALTGKQELTEILKGFALAKSRDVLFKELDDDFFGHRMETGVYVRKSSEIMDSLKRSVDTNPVPFAVELVGHMEQALSRYKKNPY